jgi:hypothetical protein
VNRADNFGLTDADFVANRETVETNIRRIVVERAAAAGISHANYVTQVFLPRLVADGVTDDEIVWLLGVLAKDS